MGAAYDPPNNSLVETYVEDVLELERGCVARLKYEIQDWAAFWMKLEGVDLSLYDGLVFDFRADPQYQLPSHWEMKIELKRANLSEVSIKYVSGITTDWQTKSVDLSDFAPSLSSYEGMEELVFTFEANKSGTEGIVYLDNITFNP